MKSEIERAINQWTIEFSEEMQLESSQLKTLNCVFTHAHKFWREAGLRDPQYLKVLRCC